jgi:hypothetical protein
MKSLGKVGMCWSQPARIDYMCKNMWARGGRKILPRVSLPVCSRRVTSGYLPVVACSLTNYGLAPFFPFFSIFLVYFFSFLKKFGDGPGILEEWVYNTLIFWTLPLHLEG